MAELSLPLKPELKKSLERYDVRPHDGKISSFEISKMPAEARAQLFENALTGSENGKRIALALFKKMTDRQILTTINLFSSKASIPVCPAAAFYLGSMIDQDFPRLEAMFQHRGDKSPETPRPEELMVLSEMRFSFYSLSPE